MDKCVIYGAGNQGQIIYELLKDDFSIEAFIDEDPSKRGKTLKEINIISLQDYVELGKSWPVFISPKYHTESIINLLKEHNVKNYVALNEIIDNVYSDKEFSLKENYFLKKEYKIVFEKILNLYKGLLKDYFVFNCLNVSCISEIQRIDYNKINYPVIVKNYNDDITNAYKIIFNKDIHHISLNDFSDKIDLLLIHGLGLNYAMEYAVIQAKIKNIPILFVEDGFIRSITPVGYRKMNVPLKYRQGCAAILDSNGIYINASGLSFIELGLNSEWYISDEQKERARNLIDIIIQKKISKYNHQPIMNLNIGDPSRKKILVIDQVYGDKSITFGWADDQTFSSMLEAAIKENPEADILVKTHPVGNISKGYFTDMECKDNLYKIDFSINPISLLEQVDKVYVCTSQMGFEALMCGKEVHVFGMPFYAGWGATLDRQKNPRRTKKRSMEEIFYVAYVMCTTYVSYKTNSVCEIEQAIDELLELREEYWAENS